MYDETPWMTASEYLAARRAGYAVPRRRFALEGQTLCRHPAVRVPGLLDEVRETSFEAWPLFRSGWADFIDRRIEHTGWFADALYDNTCRGAVLRVRIPRKLARLERVSTGDAGWTRCRYAAGYCFSRWETKGADLSRLYRSPLAAARAADKWAEHLAERERTYQAETEAASRIALNLALIHAAREAARDMLRLWRDLGPKGLVSRETIATAVRLERAEMRALRCELRQIRADAQAVFALPYRQAA